MSAFTKCLLGLALIILCISIYLEYLLQTSKSIIPISDKPNNALYQQVKLNNITIGYAEYGNIKSKNVMITFHGTPSSRLEMSSSFDDIFKDIDTSNIRVISVDRPGFGLSSYYDFNPISFAQSIILFADKLKLQKFMIFGTSGGGPFTLATALVIPSSRLLGVLCVVCVSPINFEHSLNGMQTGSRILFSLPPYIGAYFLYANTAVDASSLTESILDQEILQKYPDFAKGIVLNMKTAFNNGVAGVMKDLKIIHDYNKWEFTIQQLCNTNNIQIYCLYGMNDMNVPISHSFWLENRLKLAGNNKCNNVKIIRQNNRSHLSMIFENKQVSNIINKLLKLGNEKERK